MNEDNKLVSKRVTLNKEESYNVINDQEELHNIIKEARKELHMIFDEIDLDYEK